MTFRIACLAAALACSAAASAAPLLGKDELKANKVRIEAQYDQAQIRCKHVEGHARELCNEQARGERDVQAAELQLRAEPTPANGQKLRLAKAEAAYAQALVKCKAILGAARSVCREDARAVFESAKAEAKLQQEVVAQALNSENQVRERAAQADRIAQAQFTAARERCEMLPGEARAACLTDARQRFGRP
ncbi:hypothetical protein [Ramlibacter montanisoli]|uniref:Uncharacterized protein n=1 Tax=Ramlibacter montanisoli TaxID=2732512 RepID=A0A849KAW8_9BURK|nr:hypothetical protein [Ramlibacter montanisoli]NNU42656.1 hypothetical protein [Ramlibacter montanisoli]